jgi:hypothetical protein
MKKSVFALLALTTMFTIGVAPTVRADEASQEDNKACEKVFSEARKLPAPSPRSIYNYGSRVVNQGGECLKKGTDAIRSTGSGRGTAERAD